MTDNTLVGQFAIGKAPYARLSDAALQALKKQAGYMPGTADFELPETLDALFKELYESEHWVGNAKADASKGSALDEWLQRNYDISLEAIVENTGVWWYDQTLQMLADHDERSFVPPLDQIISHSDRPRINGVIQLPTMKLPEPISKQSVEDLLLEWTKGRAWLAGGMVVSYFKPFESNDYDLFCWTDEDYEELVAEANSGAARVLDKNDRSILISNPSIRHLTWQVKLNIVRPCDEDWSEPYNVLKDFDLTCSAMLLKNAEEAYAWRPLHIKNNQMAIIKLKHPMKTMSRVFKYWGRGFEPTAGLWYELSQNQKSMHLMKMIAPLTHVFSDNDSLAEMAVAAGEIEYDTSVDEYYDEEEFFQDDDYWY